MWNNFRNAKAGFNALLWYGPPDATDLRRPVDAGYATSLKLLIANEDRKLLDIDNSSEKWYGNEVPYTAKERFILITHWTGNA